MTSSCHCGSGASFDSCCQSFLSGSSRAATAEALMRSRFTAFCRGEVDYLLATHHPGSHSANERAETQQSIAATEWLNLTIVETLKGRADDGEGIVQFAAAFRKKPLSMLAAASIPLEIGQMHERSRFIREEERWFYVDGDQLPPHQTPRNAPCWCGSGKKTKQCHG